jgi:hypothetical protein
LPDAFQFQSTSFNVSADQTRDIVLPPTVVLRVRVLDASGNPISNTEVGVPLPQMSGSSAAGTFGQAFYLNGTTDSNGNADFVVFKGEGPATGGRVKPPSSSGYGEAGFNIPDLPTDTTITVRPPRTVRVSGVLKDAAGNPLGGVDVGMQGGGSYLGTKTDTDGAFSFRAAPGSYAFSASGVGGGPVQLFQFHTPSFNVTQDETRDIVLPPTVVLRVRVLDASSNPLPNTKVYVPLPPGSSALGTFGEAFDLYQTTDSNGFAAFVVFKGQGPATGGRVTPPSTSGYGEAGFGIPDLANDTTLSLRLGEAVVSDGTSQVVANTAYVDVSCVGVKGGCDGTVTLKGTPDTAARAASRRPSPKPVTLGKANFRLRSGGRTKVRVKLTRASLRSLAKHKRLAAKTTLTIRVAGKPRTSRRNVLLKLAKRPPRR